MPDNFFTQTRVFFDHKVTKKEHKVNISEYKVTKNLHIMNICVDKAVSLMHALNKYNIQ